MLVAQGRLYVEFNTTIHILQINPASLSCFSKFNLRTRRLISYVTENTTTSQSNQTVNAFQAHYRILFWESYQTHE